MHKDAPTRGRSRRQKLVEFHYRWLTGLFSARRSRGSGQQCDRTDRGSPGEVIQVAEWTLDRAFCIGMGPALMIIDGGAVVLDEEGRPDFGLLQRSLEAPGKKAGNHSCAPMDTDQLPHR
jgi:hypothetical protein